MRKGKNYCYDLGYWGPEPWFWPAYFPWKMHLELIDNLQPPWIAFTPDDRTSFPVIRSIDNNLYRYVFTNAGEFPVHLELQMRKNVTGGRLYAEWRMLLTIGVILAGDYRHKEESPVRRLDNSVWEDDHNAVAYGGSIPPWAVYPAVWDQTGQHPPWH